jgi:hypothetical protein
MSPDARPLPMVPFGCALDDGQLAEQLARYRHLSASVLRVDRDGPAARIQFGERVEPSSWTGHSRSSEVAAAS